MGAGPVADACRCRAAGGLIRLDGPDTGESGDRGDGTCDSGSANTMPTHRAGQPRCTRVPVVCRTRVRLLDGARAHRRGLRRRLSLRLRRLAEVGGAGAGAQRMRELPAVRAQIRDLLAHRARHLEEHALRSRPQPSADAVARWAQRARAHEPAGCGPPPPERERSPAAPSGSRRSAPADASRARRQLSAAAGRALVPRACRWRWRAPWTRAPRRRPRPRPAAYPAQRPPRPGPAQGGRVFAAARSRSAHLGRGLRREHAEQLLLHDCARGGPSECAPSSRSSARACSTHAEGQVLGFLEAVPHGGGAQQQPPAQHGRSAKGVVRGCRARFEHGVVRGDLVHQPQGAPATGVRRWRTRPSAAMCTRVPRRPVPVDNSALRACALVTQVASKRCKSSGNAAHRCVPAQRRT
jgi:hypothetical protein